MKRSLLIIGGALLITGQSLAQIQPANASFEDWETLNGSISNTYDEPVDWNTGNECSEIVNQLAVTQSSDAYAGTSSARLETLAAFGNIKINGVLTTSSMICLANGGGQEGGTAYTGAVPDSIVGWYKYAPASGDSAYAQIMFLANQDMDTVSFTRINFTQTVTEWTRFSAALTEQSSGAEKLSLFFSSSWGDGSQGEAEVGSVLLVDAVEFVNAGSNGTRDIYDNDRWNLFPNPATDAVWIDGVAGLRTRLEVLDVTGKRMFQKRITDNDRVELSGLVEGLYLYQITSESGIVLKTGKLMVRP